MTETHAPYTVGEMAETAETTHLLLNSDRDELGKYVRALADEVGLRDWTITISGERSDDGTMAQIAVTYGQKRATVKFDPNWANWDADQLRQTCVHELIHCHLNRIRESVDNVQSIVGEMVYTPLYNSVTDGIEYGTDAIASEWAKTLPLPVRDEAPAEEAA